MRKYEMDLASIVEDTEWTRFYLQTDRQTRWNQYTPLQLQWAGGIIMFKFLSLYESRLILAFDNIK